MGMPTMTEERDQAYHPSSVEWNWNGDAWDRRLRPRLDLSYSLHVRRPRGMREVETQTVNVSSDGFYFSSTARFREQERVECEMVLPWRASFGSPQIELVLRGSARVVRVEFGRFGPQFGVACRLERDYSILPLGRDPSPLMYREPGGVEF